MPIITRLVAGKRNPNRVNIYCDGVFALTLSFDEVVKQRLKKGLELKGEEVAKLKEDDATDYIYNKLLNFLSYRPRTVKEVYDRLYKYDVKDKEAQNRLIKKLESQGYLDDLAFAKWFIESRNTHRPRSPRRLEQELLAKGVSRATVQEVIIMTADTGDTIKRLIKKKLGSPRPLNSQERQRISVFLVRQGFTWDKVKEVVKNWESE